MRKPSDKSLIEGHSAKYPMSNWKWSRPPKTRKVWESAAVQRSWRRDDNYMAQVQVFVNTHWNYLSFVAKVILVAIPCVLILTNAHNLMISGNTVCPEYSDITHCIFFVVISTTGTKFLPLSIQDLHYLVLSIKGMKDKLYVIGIVFGSSD